MKVFEQQRNRNKNFELKVDIIFLFFFVKISEKLSVFLQAKLLVKGFALKF